MKENKYDDESFFEQYSRMARSVGGLKSAGEWHVLQQMLPDFEGKRVLDLGCGFGWHCRYAVEHGAASVVGIDLSEKMLEEAEKRNSAPEITYRCMAVEDYDFQPDRFDVVISSLTFHYLESFDEVCRKISLTLSKGGTFVFSVEHPVFTAYGSQDWYYDEDGTILHWPVDHYFSEGERKAVFLGEEITKYHKTLTTYVNGLIRAGFEITALIEPEPEPDMLDHVQGMRDELRRPMMLLISAIKR
ncbi:MAG: class I SAM-dependent methyltransferase [Bacteroides sp.]